MSLENLQIAALIHDIGKFYQRTGKKHNSNYNNLSKDDYGQNGAHSKWSASYCSDMGLDPEIEELVLYHHYPTKSGYVQAAKILQKADQHSSKERQKSGGKKEVKKEPLISVFSKVNIEKNKQTSEYYIPLKKLTTNANEFFPRPSKAEAMEGWNLQDSYQKLWSEFQRESEIIKKQTDFNTLFYLTKKYTSLIPSAVYVDEPDISLFDHSKTTAALATCLYHYQQEHQKIPSDKDNCYMVISGDLSGIQDFIYKISSPQEAQKGMSKRLRGRSFYLTLLNDAVAHRIIRELELCEANILFLGGGHFTIIAPNTENSKTKLAEITAEVNHELYKKFQTDIYLALSTQNCSGNDLENFGQILSDASFENQKNKRKKFHVMLEDVFAEEESPPSNVCPVCGNQTSHPDNLCLSCTDHEELGGKIANSQYIVRGFNTHNQEFDVIEFEVGYHILKTATELKKTLKNSPGDWEVLKLNNTNFVNIRDIYPGPVGFTFLGNTVPRHSKEGTLFFNQLAEISHGATKLGILKMDVDNLGRIFADGLENPTISRVSTMSSFLDNFFSGYINQLAQEYRVLEDVCPDCQSKTEPLKLQFNEDDSPVTVYREKESVCEKCAEKAIPTIYIVYSGGDDLLVLGPYDDIIQFSYKLRKAFSNWTCQNPDLTLSAGIFLAGGKFPVERGVKNSDQYLEMSKEVPGKDSVTLFTETVKWDGQDLYKGFKDLFEFAIKLEELNKKNKISKGLVYSMLFMWESTFGGIDSPSQDKSRLIKRNYVPMFKYKLRTVQDSRVREELNREGVKFMPWIKIPASWVSLRTR